MSLAVLPIFVKLAGRPVMLIGSGEAADRSEEHTSELQSH